MTRERFLAWLLLIGLLAGGLYLLAEHQLELYQQELTQAEAELEQARPRATEAKAQVAERDRLAGELAGLSGQLLPPLDPVPVIRNELMRVAQATGVKLTDLTVEPAVELAKLPSTLQYPVRIRVAGAARSVAAFVAALERSPYRLQLPDLALDFTGSTQLGGTALLSFFGQKPPQ